VPRRRRTQPQQQYYDDTVDTVDHGLNAIKHHVNDVDHGIDAIEHHFNDVDHGIDAIEHHANDHDRRQRAVEAFVPANRLECSAVKADVVPELCVRRVGPVRSSDDVRRGALGVRECWGETLFG